MDINNLERANELAKGLLPKVDILLDVYGYTNIDVGETLIYLLDKDEDFCCKFKQLLLEVKHRFQKEFDEI